MVYPRIDRHLFELIVIVDLQCCVHFSCSFIKIVGKLSPLPRLILREWMKWIMQVPFYIWEIMLWWDNIDIVAKIFYQTCHWGCCFKNWAMLFSLSFFFVVVLVMVLMMLQEDSKWNDRGREWKVISFSPLFPVPQYRPERDLDK